jgi:MFS transporter, SP family, sugar:H+ symporter
MKPFLKQYRKYDSATGTYGVSSSVLSLVTSIINAGEFVGAVTAFFVGEKIGRRGGLYLSSICVVIGTLVQVAGSSEGTLIVGRLVLGYAVGLISCFVPLYVADCAPMNLRGALVSCYQMAIAIGLILGVVIDYAMNKRSDSGSFRIPMAVQFVFTLILITGLFCFALESPRWLLANRGPAEAAAALKKLGGKRKDEDALRVDLRAMEKAIEEEQAMHGESAWRWLLNWGPEGRKAYLGFALPGIPSSLLPKPLTRTRA